MFSHVCTRPPLVGREGSAACWANTAAFFRISRSCYVSQGQRTRELASVDTWQRKHDPSCPAASWCQRQRFVNPNYQDTLLVTFSGPARPSLHNTRRSGLSSNFWIPPLETRVRSSCGKTRKKQKWATATWAEPYSQRRHLHSDLVPTFQGRTVFKMKRVSELATGGRQGLSSNDGLCHTPAPEVLHICQVTEFISVCMSTQVRRISDLVCLHRHDWKHSNY